MAILMGVPVTKLQKVPVEYERIAGQMSSSRADDETANSAGTLGLGQIEIAPPAASQKANFLEVQSGEQ